MSRQFRLGELEPREYTRLMDVKKYQTANSWFSAMRGEGYEVPVTLCQEIESIMKAQKISFPEAYEIINSQKRITQVDKKILYRTR